MCFLAPYDMSVEDDESDSNLSSNKLSPVWLHPMVAQNEDGTRPFSSLDTCPRVISEDKVSGRAGNFQCSIHISHYVSSVKLASSHGENREALQ